MTYIYRNGETAIAAGNDTFCRTYTIRTEYVPWVCNEPCVSPHGNARVDPLAWLAGWQAMGGKVEER